MEEKPPSSDPVAVLSSPPSSDLTFQGEYTCPDGHYRQGIAETGNTCPACPGDMENLGGDCPGGWSSTHFHRELYNNNVYIIIIVVIVIIIIINI